MAEKEMMQKNIEEFVLLQSYMLLADKDSELYLHRPALILQILTE